MKTPDTHTEIFEFTFETDFELLKKHDLGEKPQICKICGAKGHFHTWLGIEMFVGTREEFNYFLCPECEVLQIEEIPKDMGKYYADDYYSYKEPTVAYPRPGVKRDNRAVLDVGCGAGAWLNQQAAMGFVNLYGCDPFIKEDIEYRNGIKISKCTVHQMTGEYDIINLSASFEHMADPHEVFKSFGRLLKRGEGTGGITPYIDIAIPIFPNTAFEIYGPFWYQMDPPRHFFIHSRKSIDMLAERNGFKVDSFEQQANAWQFPISRGYQLGVPFTQHFARQNEPVLSEVVAQQDNYNVLTAVVMAAQTADTAKFRLVRNG